MISPANDKSSIHHRGESSEKQGLSKSKIEARLDALYAKTDLSSTYELTIPLLISAQIGDKKLVEKKTLFGKIAMFGKKVLFGKKTLYSSIIKNIFKNLGLSDKTTSKAFQRLLTKWGDKGSFNIWLMGRILVASDSMHEKQRADHISKLMQEGLNMLKTDAFTTWAYGYLAVYHASNKKKYSTLCDQMMMSLETLKSQPGEKENDNVQWAIVMDLLAAGSANDTDTYEKLLLELKNWTDKESVTEAILTIPKKDFTAWALAIVRVAAAKIGDTATYNELGSTINQAILVSPSDQDKLLAEVNNILSEQFVENNR